MNRRTTTLLLCAFVLAAGASFVVYRLVRKQISDISTKRVKLVVAARDLEIGTLIKEADLKMGAVVGDSPSGALLKIESAVGRGVVAPVYMGEPVIEKRLAM